MANNMQVLPPHDTQFVELFQKLIDSTPRDQNGFLLALYDPTLIPPDFAERPQAKQQAILKAATLPLSMFEGYHSFSAQTTHAARTHKKTAKTKHTQAQQLHSDTPTPVWNRLPHEPSSLYDLFKHFILQPSRAIHNIPQTATSTHAFSVREAYTLFYWKDRARSYDLLKLVAASKLREQRSIMAEDKHYMLSESLLDSLQDELRHRAGEQDQRPFAGLKAKEIIDGLVTAVGMQRVSLGLPATGPSTSPRSFQPTNFAGTERAIKEVSQQHSGVSSGALSPLEISRQQLEKTLTEDPEAAAALQQAALDVYMKARKQAQDQPQEE